MLSDILVIAAATAFVLGYLIINQIALRFMLLVGTGLYIWYYAVVADSPLWAAIWASAATGTANIVGLTSLFLRKSKWIIPNRDKDLYPEFEALPPGDFRQLVLLARRETRMKNEVLTTSGSAVTSLFYVISGRVEIRKKGSVFSMRSGNFVGEVAFLTNEAASATTLMATDGELLCWDVEQLRRRAERDTRFRLALDAMISLDLAYKVANAGSPIAEPASAHTKAM
ncbi:cyclic nucleotide-binding domain-containing protein [Aliiroseovarius pelagivivens]|uniref:cyclic nucleotide-binding domain-containing protein n=1 Tax=Aliiroseovarius pelagivivens TaxID=1639690 RepID=UPI0015E80F26|nr:cyclic nucleotide-binding domain-containing protein [Aliiroseovarius pelagivivens]